MIYQRLGKMYGYTPSQIADMTPYQQLMMLGASPSSPDSIAFDTQEAYDAWVLKKKAKGEF